MDYTDKINYVDIVQLKLMLPSTEISTVLNYGADQGSLVFNHLESLFDFLVTEEKDRVFSLEKGIEFFLSHHINPENLFIMDYKDNKLLFYIKITNDEHTGEKQVFNMSGTQGLFMMSKTQYFLRVFYKDYCLYIK